MAHTSFVYAQNSSTYFRFIHTLSRYSITRQWWKFILLYHMSISIKAAIYKRQFYYMCLQVAISLFVCFWCNSPQWARASSFTRFLDHKQWRTTVGTTPLDEWSAHRRDLYLTTHNTHNKKTSMLLAGFEPTISAGEWPQTYNLDRAATGTGK